MMTSPSDGRLPYLVSFIFLALTAGCVRDSAPANDFPVHDLAVTVKCGTDVSLSFNVSGNVKLRTQDMLASKCNIQGNGNNMTVLCPGNGLNWTQFSQKQLGRLVAANPFAGPVPQAAARNFSGSAS